MSGALPPELLIPIITLLGLIFGSFASAIASRVPEGKSFLRGRSACPVCHTTLGARDLIPVLSWLLARGKCRHCHTPIGWRYPLMELTMAGIFLLVYATHGWSLTTLLLCLLAFLLLIMIWIDLTHMIIPDGLNLSLFILALIWAFCMRTEPLLPTLGWMLAKPLIALLAALLLRQIMFWWKKQEGLGLGDVKFLAATAPFLWLEAISFFLLAAGLSGLVFVLFWRKMGGGARFPFGPALAGALFVCVTWPAVPNAWLSLMMP